MCTRTEHMPDLAHAPSLELDYGLVSFLALSDSMSFAFLYSPAYSRFASNPHLEDRTDAIVSVVNFP